MKELSLKELEILAQAYLECRLSRLQEKELELILYDTDVTSPVIEEARRTMGVSTLLAEVRDTSGRTLLLPRRNRFAAAGWVAACVGMIALSAMIFLTGRNLPLDSHEGSYVSVYVDGKPLTGDAALAEAATAQALDMDMMCQLMAGAREDYERNVELIND